MAYESIDRSPASEHAPRASLRTRAGLLGYGLPCQLLCALLGLTPARALASDPDPSPPAAVPAEPPPAVPDDIPEPSQAALAVPADQSASQRVEARPPVVATPPVAAAPPAGQWVYTRQYGWVWMPYDAAYTYVPNDGYPAVYLYGPRLGWRWVAAPWVFGWGPQPHWGVRGRARFVWYTHPWFVRREYRGHVHYPRGERGWHSHRRGRHGHRR